MKHVCCYNKRKNVYYIFKYKQAVFAHYFSDVILLFLFYIYSHYMFRLYLESAIIIPIHSHP
jgi:hypothetical protein